MPIMCFSYQPDLPPGNGARAVAPPDPHRMITSHCFSYSADLSGMSTGTCFSYTTEVPRRMPAGPCFSYPANAPQSALPGLRTMTYSTCFRY
jgi:hypothetical protein